MKVMGMSNQDSAVYLQRIVNPLKYMAKQKLAEVHHLPIFGQHRQNLTSAEFREYQEKEGEWADILFSTCASDAGYLALLWAMRDKYKLKLVIDLDDDILSTHLEPNNPAYKAYLQPGARYAEFAQACLREADLVTVSTEYLKKKYESINKNIVVIPNFIDPDLWKFTHKPKDVLGFSGSGSHQADWNMIEPMVKEAKFKSAVLSPVRADVDNRVNWVDMLYYPKELSDMHFGVGLAPLKDTLMARGKSNLRWLEYSQLGIPTVASNTLPFKGIENIILCDEPEDWTNAFKKLEDKEYRTELGKKAKIEMKDKYDPRRISRKLFESF